MILILLTNVFSKLLYSLLLRTLMTNVFHQVCISFMQVTVFFLLNYDLGLCLQEVDYRVKEY